MVRFIIFSFFLLQSVAYSITPEEVINNHPKIKALNEKLMAIKEKERYISQLPDPVVSISINDIQLFYRPFDRGLEPMQVVQFAVSQRYIPAGKRQLKKEKVQAVYSVEYYRLQQQKLELIFSLYEKIIKIWELNEKLKIIKQYRKISRDLIALTNTLYSVGKVSQSEVFDVQLFYLELKRKEILLEGLYRELKSELGYLTDEEVEFQPIEPYKPEDIGMVIERARKHSPYILIPLKEVQLSQKELSLAKKRFIPDYSIFATYGMRDGFNDFVSFGVSFNLPFWRKDKTHREILEKSYLKQSYYTKYKDSLKSIQTRIETSYYRLLTAYESYNLLRGTIKDQAEAVYESLISEYQVGEKNIFDLLGSVKQILSIKERIVEEISSFNIHLKKIQKLTGELR